MRLLGSPHAPGSMQHGDATRNNSCPVESCAKPAAAFLLTPFAHARGEERGERSHTQVLCRYLIGCHEMQRNCQPLSRGVIC
jgi:hypothetical protein